MAAALCLLTGLITPAHAQQPDLRIAGLGNIELRVGGGAQNVNIVVENRSNQPTGIALGVQLTMVVPLSEFGVHIASTPGECNRSNDDTRMDCNLGDIGPGQSRSVTAQIAVQGNSTLQAGETRNGNAQVALSTGGQGSFNVRLQGPDRPEGVPEVTGIVTDLILGEGLEGASVFLTDSQGGEFTTTTDGSGNFRFAGEEIAAGTVGLRASKDGFESAQVTETAQPGEALTGVQIALRNTASPTPSAEPDPTTEAPATASTPVAAPVSNDSGGGTFTTIMIILGGLFVLLGIGAIVLLIIRRRRERNEDEGPDGADSPISGPRGPGPTPGAHGVYRPTPTQVMGPRGPLPAVGPQPALANASAQTMMMQPAGVPAGETAVIPRAGDGPPGAPGRPMGPRPPVAGSPPPPRPAAPTYGSAAATAAYEEAGRHGGQPGRYDEPTQIGRGYGSPAGTANGYGSPAAAGGPPGYGSPAGYGSTGRHDQGGGYGSPSGSAYDSGSGYGPDPYTQPQPSYDDGGGYRGGGYEAAGGYDDGGSYGRASGAAGYDRGASTGGYERGTGAAGYERAGGAPAPERGAAYRGTGYGDTGQAAAPGGGYGNGTGYSAGSAGYGNAAGGTTYGNAAGTAGYGNAASGTEYGSASGGGGYGNAPGNAGYSGGAASGSGYGEAPTGHYGGGQTYGQPGNYEQAGYQQQPGHQQQPAHQPGGQQPGYQPGGYGQPGHAAPNPAAPGHGQPPYDPAADQRGYPAAYPDEQPADPRSRHAEPTERRRLDWLDQ